ncbi:MAG TPA: phage BR0599 family protein, partial [Geminicoccaceae bacterium]|nr:phage BR0599 family protein [Geminicoccaceae bacterium]
TLKAYDSFTRVALVEGVTDHRVFTLSEELLGFGDGWFDEGAVTFETGANSGRTIEVKSWMQAIRRLELWAPEGRSEQFATVERQQMPVGDSETVTVLRPVAAGGEKTSGQEEDVQRERPLTWQVAAGWRLWLIDPAAKDLRTCAVRSTSTVGVEAIRCLSISASRFRRTFGPTVTP